MSQDDLVESVLGEVAAMVATTQRSYFPKALAWLRSMFKQRCLCAAGATAVETEASQWSQFCGVIWKSLLEESSQMWLSNSPRGCKVLK